MYLWQAPDWPRWRHNAAALQPVLSRVRLAQGCMLGLAEQLDLVALGELQLQGWADEAVATAQIEGEVLQLHSVRASAARRLGLDGARPHARDAALFPTGFSGMHHLVVGDWRQHAEPMQIVTPRIGKPDLVHHEAPPSSAVPDRTGSSAG